MIRPADEAAIAEAARLLRAGELVGIPTETVYGLAGDATNADAIARLYAAKGRPPHNPLIIHFDSAEAAFRHGEANALAETLAKAFWPGPLTMVLAKRIDSPVVPAATAGLDTIGLRVPATPVAAKLFAAAGVPVAAPSANLSNQISPTTAQHVADGLGDKVALILDAGPCAVGVESTVVGVSGDRPVLLRPGGVSAEDIERVVGPLDRPEAGATITSPGMLKRHYAPATRVRLNATEVAADEALLAFGPALTGAKATANLSPARNLGEAAANLYAMLHALDRVDAAAIAVMPIPEDGLGRAINDRLRRAATAADESC
ncbi:MAG: L-threonylcarbamoyladenylate synthase [Alphaproteobacteria bacterium]